MNLAGRSSDGRAMRFALETTGLQQVVERNFVFTQNFVRRRVTVAQSEGEYTGWTEREKQEEGEPMASHTRSVAVVSGSKSKVECLCWNGLAFHTHNCSE